MFLLVVCGFVVDFGVCGGLLFIFGFFFGVFGEVKEIEVW